MGNYKKRISAASVFLSVTIFLLFSLFPGCSHNPFKKYTLNHNNIHFSFEYPSSYEKQLEYIKDSALAPVGIRFSRRMSNGSTITLVLNISNKTSEVFDAHSAVERTISGLDDSNAVLERSNLNISNIPGELVVYIDSRMPANQYVREVIFENNNLVLDIGVYNNIENQFQAKSDFEHVIQTFQIPDTGVKHSDIYFPAQKEAGINMDVLGWGFLTLDDGYFKVSQIFKKEFIIFPYGYTYKIEGCQITVFNEKGQVAARVGGLVKIGGGEMTDKPTAEKIVGQQLPADFNGPYWLAGSVSPWP